MFPLFLVERPSSFSKVPHPSVENLNRMRLQTLKRKFACLHGKGVKWPTLTPTSTEVQYLKTTQSALIFGLKIVQYVFNYLYAIPKNI